MLKQRNILRCRLPWVPLHTPFRSEQYRFNVPNNFCSPGYLFERFWPLKVFGLANIKFSNPPSTIGVRAGVEELRWLWERKFAAVAGDMAAFEATPFQSTDYWFHEWLLAGWGMPMWVVLCLICWAALIRTSSTSWAIFVPAYGDK